MIVRSVVLVAALLPALAVAAPKKRGVRPPPPGQGEVFRSDELPEKDLPGGAKQRSLVEQLRAKPAPIALRHVRLLREKELYPPRGNVVVSVLVLEGALRVDVPEAKFRRKKLAALSETLGPGDGLYARVPHRTGWKLVGEAEETRALVVVVPAPAPKKRTVPLAPVTRRAAAAPEYEIANGKGSVRMVFDPSVSKDASVYVGRFRAVTGLTIPEHVHAHEAELLVMQTGFGEITLNGKAQPVIPGDVVYVPPNTPHAFRVTSSDAVHAVQLYTPSGPEQRFKKPVARLP